MLVIAVLRKVRQEDCFHLKSSLALDNESKARGVS